MNTLTSFIGWMFERIDGFHHEVPPSMPWDRRPSILEFVRVHIVPETPGVTEGGEILPDEKRISKWFRLRWAPRTYEGNEINCVGTRESRDKVKATVDLVAAYCEQPTAVNKALIYQYIVDGQVCSTIDPVVLAVRNNSGINHSRLYELAYSFVTESPDRDPVKFGIAFLGLFHELANEELFVTLGRHEEFTSFIATALADTFDDHETTLWKLACNVNGWGRIRVVKCLSKTKSPKIKNWLLREGFRNSVHHNYLAETCATAGGLLSALRDEYVDRELLTSAGEIIQALITGGPAEGIDDYEDGLGVIQSYVSHMEVWAETCADFLHVASILTFLNEDESKWRTREHRGWYAPRRELLKNHCNSILSRPEWPNRVRAALKSPDEVTHFNADQAAKALGIDAWSFHWKRLLEMPVDSNRWLHVMSSCNDEHIAAVIQFAEKYLDLDLIMMDPGNEPIIGPRLARHTCLDLILQELHRFPGQGRAVITAGLKSPVMRNRKMAVAALAVSPRHKWPNGLHGTLKLAAIFEPNESLRREMRMVLSGQALDAR